MAYTQPLGDFDKDQFTSNFIKFYKSSPEFIRDLYFKIHEHWIEKDQGYSGREARILGPTIGDRHDPPN